MAYSLLTSLCVIALAPRTAEATSCAPTLEQMVPADEELLPVSARPLGSFDCGADLTGWEVDIDGEPAELSYEDPEFGYGILAMGFNPEPIEGSVVEIRGCSWGCWEEEPEFDIVRTYVVGEEDEEAPADPVLIELGHVDEIVTEWDWSFDDETMRAVRRWTVHFEAPALDEPVVWEFEVGPEDDRTRVARILEEGDATIVINRFVSDAGQEVCATARAYDLSGNASEERVICVEVEKDDELPPLPEDSGDDGGDDGSDDGDDDGGDDGLEDGGDYGDIDDGGDDEGLEDDDGDASFDGDVAGCSCTAGDDSPVGLGALLGLMLLGLRRRRQ